MLCRHPRVASLTSFLSGVAAPRRRRVLRVLLAIHASRSSKLVVCEFLLHQAASVPAGLRLLPTVHPPAGAASAIAPLCWRLAKPSPVEPVATATGVYSLHWGWRQGFEAKLDYVNLDITKGRPYPI
ncbi:hypothetical protein Scep_022192 [Stephania cephalantha]|uniref:Uncharacterized protein n=1 Tax=Stephania cephalantha TaxID=152367 RepID=A0AAP0F9Z3_9MAGN